MKDIVDTLPGAIWQIGWQPHGFEVVAISAFGPGFPMPGDAARLLAIHPDDQAAAAAAFAQSAAAGSPLHGRYRVAAGEGWCWLGIHARPQPQPGGDCRWHAFVHDAGEEAALAEVRDAAVGSERRIREVLDRMPGTVFELRRETDGRVHFTFISDGIRELGGVEPEECRKNPMKMFERIVPEDLKSVIEGIRTGEMGSVIRTYRVRHPDGRLIWVRNFALKRMAADGAMIATCCLQDFTEAMQLQQQLAEARDAAEAAERRVREVTESLPGMVYEIQLDFAARASRLVYVTDGVADLYGVSRDQAMADHERLSRMTPPDDRARIEQDFLSSLKTDAALWQRLDEWESELYTRHAVQVQDSAGNTSSVSSVEEIIPPMTTVASGRCTSAPMPVFSAIGTKPRLATNAVMRTGRSRMSAPSIIDETRSPVSRTRSRINASITASHLVSCLPRQGSHTAHECATNA